jgi:hypothetical protein
MKISWTEEGVKCRIHRITKIENEANLTRKIKRSTYTERQRRVKMKADGKETGNRRIKP